MLRKGLISLRDFTVDGKIRTGVEGWIDVDEIHFAGEFGEERGEDVFLVAPDEAVAPFGVAAAGEEFEIAAAVLGAFVDGFDGLKRQGDAHRALFLAVFVFAIPDEFGHVPLVLEPGPTSDPKMPR